MAERRMMAKSVIETDHFMDMPMSSQCLYFHLLLRADDDGFIKNPSAIRREVGCGEDDMKLLVAKQFILPFDTGVIVIRHWKIHNYIRKDMYHPTECQAERGLLTGGADKTAYVPKEGVQIQGRNVIVTDTSQTCNDHVTDSSRSCTEPVSIGKVRLGKVNNNTTTTTRACAGEDSDTDQALSRVVKLYADNINPSYGPIESEKLLMLYDRYHSKWLEAAIIEAAESSRRPSVKYIAAILERWERDGFKAPKKGRSNRNGRYTQGNSRADREEPEGLRKLKEDMAYADAHTVHPWDVRPDGGGDGEKQEQDSCGGGRAGAM